MASHRRSQSFRHARTVLADRLAQGRYVAETRLAAGDLAAELGLSPTPMREVLARFVGEGLLVERPGQGVFVPRLSAREVADLYRLGLAHLQIALRTRRAVDAAGGQLAGEGPTDGHGAIAACDALFERWVLDAGSPMLARSFGRVQRQLAPIRRVEAEVLDNLVEEHAALVAQASLSAARRLSGVRDYFHRRGRSAARLAERLEPHLRADKSWSWRDLG